MLELINIVTIARGVKAKALLPHGGGGFTKKRKKKKRKHNQFGDSRSIVPTHPNSRIQASGSFRNATFKSL